MFTCPTCTTAVCERCREIVRSLPDCEERSVALRKLLEAKDAAVRSAIP